MREAGIEGSPPTGLSKDNKAREWLRRANKSSSEPLDVLGKVLIELMEVDGALYDPDNEMTFYPEREKVLQILGNYDLTYQHGGHIVGGGVSPVSRKLGEIISSRDLSGLQTEFERISKNVDADPAAAVTASCALLESLFKQYIEDENLTMPADQSIKPLWNVIRKDLKLDPAAIQDEDLRKVLSGLASIADGIGALRTHKGSAHGHVKTVYKLKPRHARLAAHAAYTLASFVLEAWIERTR